MINLPTFTAAEAAAETIRHDLADQSLGELEDPSRQGFIREIGRADERQGAFEAVEQRKKLLAILPTRHGVQVEPGRHFSGLVDEVIDGDLTDQNRRNVELAADSP